MTSSRIRSPTAAVLGRIGLPDSVGALAARRWDVVVVGAGHNGLACAAYLARAGRRVLVLEAMQQVGGACTLEEPWPGVRMSPCAYVCGLLHPLVIHELDLPGHGFRWTPASGGLFVPFEDGSSIQLWNDDERCEEEIRRFAPQDLRGWRAMQSVKRRVRDALRPEGEGDIWIGPSPSREEIEHLLDGDAEACGLLFEWSMVELVERYLSDERMQLAYLGQGVIGTNASPHDRGTASIYYHHASGRMEGQAGTWGYVEGGMGMVSFILCDVAKEAGAVVAAGAPVARILPGEGVELTSGERIVAAQVVSNADPRVTLALLDGQADEAWEARVREIPIEGVTVKVNMTLSELPDFTARPGTREPHHTGQVNTPLTKDEWRGHHQMANVGELPPRVWAELYLQTVFDTSIALEGVHTLSVFAQYVPYRFRKGSWDTRRDEVGSVVVDSIARFCSNLPRAITALEVLGPPDIERRVGLTGGHIFQGEILPDYMWDRRLTARTPMPGVYLCGACTYPGGSVMGINGRNAANIVLSDTEKVTRRK
ncbi:MAG: NAD(P)/FAD-dependent oxidoreductase [Gemmatimonadales bacterium]|nr:NAD(P)/FAD-dependent oxidoreductase [Gemmatimonadales bacterium]MDQ3427848.1 NAD(P)/FAD-dependent oxidoreductase [Gemmatimonadota bacterium]